MTRLAALGLVLWLLSLPGRVGAQPFDPETSVYGVSSIDYAMWVFDRHDPLGPRTRVDISDSGVYGVSVAIDSLTNHLYVRPQARETVYCFDAISLELHGEDEPGTCTFRTPGSDGAITVDPLRRVLYSDGGVEESDDCELEDPRHDSIGEVNAYSIDPSNRGTLLDTMVDAPGGHWATDGNHLFFDPVDRLVWSSPSEWTDGIRPRTIEVGTLSMRGGGFGALTVTGLPTIMPGSSIGVDADERRVYLIPWTPPTIGDLDGGSTADTSLHPEALYVHAYDMDSFDQLDVLDGRDPPDDWDDNTHCGYNTDFRVFYDRVAGFVYESAFYEHRVVLYDTVAGTVDEVPPGEINDLYGFDALLPLDSVDTDTDDDGIVDSVELGATGLVHADFEDRDPRSHTDPDAADTDGAGVPDGVEDANHDGRVDAGETDPADPSDEPDQDFDGDGVGNSVDNCRAVANPDQADADGNGRGDACEGPDADADGWPDAEDDCRCVPDPGQEDTDGDGAGDVCALGDEDGDGAGDDADNCACLANPGQADTDEDGIGNACSLDTDEDGWSDANDNCPAVANAEQEDSCDRDGGRGDACGDDGDDDGAQDACDNCPEEPNPDQEDADQDGAGDACSPPLECPDGGAGDPGCEDRDAGAGDADADVDGDSGDGGDGGCGCRVTGGSGLRSPTASVVFLCAMITFSRRRRGGRVLPPGVVVSG